MTEQAEALSEMDATAQIAELMDGPEDEDQPEEDQEEAEAPEGEAEEETEADESDEAEEEPAEELEEITWNGETKQIPKSELKELAQKGFDYTQKTQQLAAERSEFETRVRSTQEQLTLQNASLEIMVQVKSIDGQLDQFKQVDWHALAESDPVKYLQLNQSYRDLKEARNEKIAEFENYTTQLQQQQQYMRQSVLAEESKQLAAKLPEMAKAGTKEALKAYLLDAGFSNADVDSLVDHRQAVIAWKAMQFDKLQSSKPALNKKVAGVPKVLKPGTNKPAPNKANADAMTQLRKTGKGEYAAKLIENML